MGTPLDVDTPTASPATCRHHQPLNAGGATLSALPRFPRFVCASCVFTSQIGGSEHSAEIHWVHVKAGTEDQLLVVGVLFDTTDYGSNVEVSAAVGSPRYYAES